MVSAPSPPPSSPHWLETFLAMEWREALDFSKHLAENGDGHSAGASHAADAAASSVRVGGSHQNPPLDVASASKPRRLLPSPPMLSPKVELPAQPGVLTRGTSTISITDSVAPSSSNGRTSHASASGHKTGAEPSTYVVSGQPVRAHLYSLATLPEIVLLPATYTWLSSDTLMAEMERHVLKLDARFQGEMFPIASQADDDHRAARSNDWFIDQSRAFAIQLPSRVVFVKIYKANRFVSTNPFQGTLTIWSLDPANIQQPLVLCGVWGVTSGVQMRVTESLLAVRYVVRWRLDVRGIWSKFLERDDAPPALVKQSTLG